MVLFEVWSVGCKPFQNRTNNEVLSLVNTGHCQPPPPGCPQDIYQLMVDCWYVCVGREGGREGGERVVLFLLLIPGRVWLDRAVSMLPALKGTLCSAKTGFVANKAERLSLPNTLIFQFHCAIYSTEVAVCWAGYV